MRTHSHQFTSVAPGSLLLDGTRRIRTSDAGSVIPSRIHRGVQLGASGGYAAYAQALDAARQLSYGYGDGANVVAIVQEGTRWVLYSATERMLDVTGRFTRSTAPLYMEPTADAEQRIDRVRDAHGGLRALVDGDYVQRF